MVNLPPFPQNPVVDSNRFLQQLIEATNRAASCSLAAGMMAAAQRPHSLEEAITLMSAAHYAMFPAKAHGRYQKWAEDPERLTRVHT